MKVRELIERLKACDPEAEAIILSSGHDRNMVADVRTDITEGEVIIWGESE